MAFPQSLHTNVRIVPQINPQTLHSMPFPVNFSLASFHSKTIWDWNVVLYVVHGLYQGIFYFQNVVWFHSAWLNVISWKIWALQYWLLWNSQMLNSIMCKSRISVFTTTGWWMWQVWIKIHIHPQMKCGFHFPKFYEMHHHSRLFCGNLLYWRLSTSYQNCIKYG